MNLILMVFAFVLLAIASRWSPPWVNLGWLGLAFWALSIILGMS